MSGAVDWANALVVAGVGFGTVFLVLSIVAVALWVVGLVTRRLAGQKNQNKDSTGRQ